MAEGGWGLEMKRYQSEFILDCFQTSPRNSAIMSSSSPPSGGAVVSSSPEYPQGNSVSCYSMCVYCFDVLVHRLSPNDMPSRLPTPTFPHANESLLV